MLQPSFEMEESRSVTPWVNRLYFESPRASSFLGLRLVKARHKNLVPLFSGVKPDPMVGSGRYAESIPVKSPLTVGVVAVAVCMGRGNELPCYQSYHHSRVAAASMISSSILRSWVSCHNWNSKDMPMELRRRYYNYRRAAFVLRNINIYLLVLKYFLKEDKDPHSIVNSTATDDLAT